MNNKTRIRLHLSKNLFESIAKEVLTEAKKANDGYTVAVKQPKMPKQSKSQATSPEVQKTDAEATMGEMETKVAEGSNLTLNKYARDLYSLFKKAGATPEIITSTSQKDMVRDPKAKTGNVLIATNNNDELFVAVKGPKETAMKYSQLVSKQFPDLQLKGDITVGQGWGGEDDTNAGLTLVPKTTAKGDTAVREVAEEGQLNEIDPSTIDWSAVAAGLGAIGLAPLAIDKIHDMWKKKFPKSFGKAQGLSGAIDKQASGN